ncbi:hypothetical protein CAPTEDRAFT_226688 [Capitella teleta]|uniref:Uncharacterized protein n=1 Tax=Capitella teleta TaxID=283909 RepID=R7U3K7_CAPTE|nr:hypothetical protein CAPTEDRAFT_226688 [Capitella teleta]|eukprot:ELT97755.1 hypothetical protein CAPTEDRAFT_226688 [Capitella teleta]
MSSADLTESRLSKHCRMDSGEPDGSQVVPCADESLANFEDVEKELDANENIIEDGLITKEMIKEEQTLHQQSMDEDKRWRQKKEKSLEEMATQEKEERYDKLKKLLRKSTVYTNYLIDRMEQQRQDEKVFREQRQKKLMERAAMKAQKQASEGILVEGKEERKSGRVLKQQMFNSQKEAGASDRGTKRKKTESPIVKKRLSDLLSPRQTKRRKVEKEEEEESQEQGESDDDEHEMEALKRCSVPLIQPFFEDKRCFYESLPEKLSANEIKHLTWNAVKVCWAIFDHGFNKNMNYYFLLVMGEALALDFGLLRMLANFRSFGFE